MMASWGCPEDACAQALDNLVVVLRACGAEPGHVVSVAIYATDMPEYRAEAAPLGDAWRARFGRHYPAMSLLGVQSLYDPAAQVELVATAVIPAE
jgi:enamine deaminase RidA (YjgF/YER057c/UK114 family)